MATSTNQIKNHYLLMDVFDIKIAMLSIRLMSKDNLQYLVQVLGYKVGKNGYKSRSF